MRLADVAAEAVVEASATYDPATITVARASGSADLACWRNPLQNILIPSPDPPFTIGSFNQQPGCSGDRPAEASREKIHRTRTLGCRHPRFIALPEPEGRVPSSTNMPERRVGARYAVHAIRDPTTWRTNIEYSIRTDVSCGVRSQEAESRYAWRRSIMLRRRRKSDTSMSEFNLADLWEAVADRVPDRVALRCGEQRRTYAQLEEQSNRLAHWYLEQGVQTGDHIGLYAENCVEYVEATLAAYKVRAVPININYRYTAGELEHLFNDADLVGVVHQWGFTNRVAEVAPRVPTLRWNLAIGSTYDSALASSSPARDFGLRSGDDRYILYTGGTTGLPKGVVWRQEDAFFACMGGGNPALPEVTSVPELVQRIAPDQGTFLLLAPLMHAAGGWVVLSTSSAGTRSSCGRARSIHPRYGAKSSERKSRPPAPWGTRSCDPCLTCGTTSIQNPTSSRWQWSAPVARPC